MGTTTEFSKGDWLIRSSRLAVRVAFFLNRIFLALTTLALLAACLLPGPFAGALLALNFRMDLPAVMNGLRWELLLGVGLFAATDRLLVTLGQMVASAGAGEPFVAENAGRLRALGWALAAIQLLDIPGALIARGYPGLGTAAPDSSFFSFSGWIAVLMVFVLSRVFRAGAAMRDDLRGTV